MRRRSLRTGGAVTSPRHVRCQACIDADSAEVSEIRSGDGVVLTSRLAGELCRNRRRPTRPRSTTLALPSTGPATVRNGEAFRRNHRGGRVVEGKRVKRQARKVDTARGVAGVRTARCRLPPRALLSSPCCGSRPTPRRLRACHRVPASGGGGPATTRRCLSFRGAARSRTIARALGSDLCSLALLRRS